MIANTSSAADGRAVYAQYKKTIDDKSNGSPLEKGQAFLRKLEKDDFLGFIRELPKAVEGYDEKNVEIVWAMAVFAKSYMEGPGKNESLKDTLKQFSDPTLPFFWKMGLADALHLSNRSDLSESETEIVINMLMEKGKNRLEPEMFQYFCLQELGSILSSQRRIIEQKSPELKEALEKQDKTRLPKKDDATVKQADKLLDSISAYKTAISKAATEIQEEKYKAQLKKRMERWEPIPANPQH
jgi:hypothetical protein